MARKTSITQDDFSFGEVREDFLERRDTELRVRSAKKIRNMRLLASGAATTRPGTVFVAEADGACRMEEYTRLDGETRGVVPIAGGIIVLLDDGTTEKTLTGLPWTGDQVCDLWMKSFDNDVLIGSRDNRPQVLNLETCVVEEYAFETNADGSTAQPYYNFNVGSTIQPDTTSGAATIIASDPVFDVSIVGQRILYSGREFEVTGFVSSTEVTGTWIQTAPETYELTMTVPVGAAAVEDQFNEGDAVEGLTSGATGIVSSVSGSVVTIIVDEAGMSFDVGEEIVGPSTSPSPDIPTVTAETEVAPAPSANWSEPVFSDFRGWPGHAECHQNRIIFQDIPAIPNALIASQAGALSNFTLGADDGDAIFETIRGGRLLYGVSAEDYLIFADDGVYYLGTRDGTALTPLGFDPRRFSSVGSAPVEPAILDDGVAYLSKCQNRLMGAVLSGDVQRYWTDTHLGEYAPHLIRKPTALGSTGVGSDDPDVYLYAVNEDGTMAVMRWQRPPFEEKIGWVLWETKGNFIRAGSLFCDSHVIVERNGVTQIERFTEDACMDGSRFYDTLADVPDPKDGLSVYADCRYLGAYDEYDVDGACYPDEWGPFEVGCAFKQELDLWGMHLSQNGKRGFKNQRNGRISISTLDSLGYTYNGQVRPAYDGSDDLSAAPPKRTECHVFCNFGRSWNPCHEIEKCEPGRITILSVSSEVQI